MVANSPFLRRLLVSQLIGLALPLVLACHASAGSLLLAPADRTFGPAGGGMGGPQIALAGSVDALWSNPAGLAKDPRTEFYWDVGTLDLTQIDVGQDTASTLGTTPGAAGWATGPTRTRPRFGYGFFLHTPSWQSSSTRLDDSRTIRSADLPAPVAGSVAYESLFPGGIERGEHGHGSVALIVVAPGFGIGIRVFDWLRMGASLRLERVSLRLEESFAQDFAANSSSGGTNALSGVTQSASLISGETNRAVVTLGLQMDLGNQVILGIVSRQPSQHLGGTGQVRVDRVDQLQVTQNGLTLHQATTFIQIDDEGLAFQLRDPGSIRVGVAMLFDVLALEVDVEQVQSLAPYAVLPRLESGPPSTSAAQLPALTTRFRAVTRYSIATAFAQGNQGSWFFGFATDPSPASADDPIYRKVDLYRVTSGYYLTRGPLSGAVRLGFATADAVAVRFPHVTDEDAVTKRVSSTVWSLGISGAYVF